MTIASLTHERKLPETYALNILEGDHQYIRYVGFKPGLKLKEYPNKGTETVITQKVKVCPRSELKRNASEPPKGTNYPPVSTEEGLSRTVEKVDSVMENQNNQNKMPRKKSLYEGQAKKKEEELFFPFSLVKEPFSRNV